MSKNPIFAADCDEHFINNNLEHWKFYYPNGYGASVISYIDDDTYELGVLKYNKDRDWWFLCYSTPITNNVIDGVDEKYIVNILKRIERI